MHCVRRRRRGTCHDRVHGEGNAGRHQGRRRQSCRIFRGGGGTTGHGKGIGTAPAVSAEPALSVLERIPEDGRLVVSEVLNLQDELSA